MENYGEDYTYVPDPDEAWLHSTSVGKQATQLMIPPASTRLVCMPRLSLQPCALEPIEMNCNIKEH